MPQTDNSHPHRLAIYEIATAMWLCRDNYGLVCRRVIFTVSTRSDFQNQQRSDGPAFGFKIFSLSLHSSRLRFKISVQSHCPTFRSKSPASDVDEVGG